MREHENQMRFLIGSDAGCSYAGSCGINVRLRGEPSNDYVGDLVDQNQSDGPTRQFGGLPQSLITPIKTGSPGVAGPRENREQNECLNHHAQRGADAKKENLSGRQDTIGSGGRAGNGDEERERGNRNNVVRDRCEHRCAELPPRVQDLRKHRVNAIEEDLRQA